MTSDVEAYLEEELENHDGDYELGVETNAEEIKFMVRKAEGSEDVKLAELVYGIARRARVSSIHQFDPEGPECYAELALEE